MATIVNKLDEKQAVNQPQAQPPNQAGAPPPTGTPPANAQQNPNKFTGIQGFLNANKGAASQLAGTIGGGVTNKINQQADTTKQQVGAVGTVGQQAKSNLNTATGFQNQLVDDTQAAALGGDQSKLDQFAGLKAGQIQQKTGQALQGATQAAGQGVNQLGQLASSNLQSLGTETGRSNLLNQYVGHNMRNYGNSSLGRLDQALLQKDTTGQINKTRQNIQGVQKNVIGGLQNQLTQSQAEAEAAQKASEAFGEVQGKQGILGTAAQGLEKQFADRLNNQANIDAVNARRTAQQNEMSDALDVIAGKKENTNNVDLDKYMNMFGLKEGTQTFGYFNDPEKFNKDALMQKGAAAMSGADLVSDPEVAKYKALANLAFSQYDANAGKAQGPRNDQYKFTKAGQLDPAVAAAMENGQSKLSSGLTTAAQDFLTKALDTDVGGYGKDVYDNGFGNSGTKEAMAHANLGQLLTQSGFTPSVYSQQGPNAVQQVTNAATGQAADPLGVGQSTLDLMAGKGDAGALANQIVNPSSVNNMLTKVPSTLTSILQNAMPGGGQEGGAQSAAARNAQADLQKNLMDKLNAMGYGNVLTKKGNVNAFQQQMAVTNAQKAAADYGTDEAKQKRLDDMLTQMTRNSDLASGSPSAYGDQMGHQLAQMQADAAAKQQAQDLYKKFQTTDLTKGTGTGAEKTLSALGYDPKKMMTEGKDITGKPTQNLTAEGKRILDQIKQFQGISESDRVAQTKANDATTAAQMDLNKILGINNTVGQQMATNKPQKTYNSRTHEWS